MNSVHVAVDIGYGYVKAISGETGKRVVFPSLVGRGHELGLVDLFGKRKNGVNNIHIVYEGNEYFVGDLAEKESGTVSRVFEQERFDHLYTKILLNTAIQLVTEGKAKNVNVSTGLPLDFYQSQRKDFRKSIIGVQPVIEWKAGELNEQSKRLNIENALVFPQGASAIFSALINGRNRYAHPDLMNTGNLIALIDIGFRTTDYVVIEIQEDSSFIPQVRLSGTIDDGVVNLHQQVEQAYRHKTGGADLNEYHKMRILNNGYITFKGERISFLETITSSKQSIASNISDRLKAVWVEETDLFDEIFIAGGGGKFFHKNLQSHFDNRLTLIEESQFANAIGYLRLGNRFFSKV